MKKIISILLGISSLALFSACGTGSSDFELEGADLTVLVNVDRPGITRTEGDTTDDLDTETTISSLKLLLFKKDGLNDDTPVVIISDTKKLAYKKVSDGVYELNAKIPEELTGDYLLYVVANMPSWLSISKYGDMAKAFSGTAVQMAACWADDNFLMINQQNDITTSGDQAGVTVTMNPSGEKVTAATVTIERIATKIRVMDNDYMKVAPLLTKVLCSGDNPGVDPDINGAIVSMSLEGYALFNCVNSFNLIQKWSAATLTGEKLLVSPSSDYSSPYSISDGYYDNDPSSLVFSDLGTVKYCMENNSPYYTDLVSGPSDATAGTKMKGRVTGIVFKARTGLAKSFSGDALINEPLGVEDSPIEWQETRGVSSDISWTSLYQYKGEYYGDISCLLRNNTALATALGTSSPTVEQLRAKDVKVFEDGYMYYNYWIVDNNYTDNGKNYLSVMRNTFYDIKITAINNMGDEFPCGGTSYNPNDPISVDVPRLTLSVEIPDWTDKSGQYVIQ